MKKKFKKTISIFTSFAVVGISAGIIAACAKVDEKNINNNQNEGINKEIFVDQIVIKNTLENSASFAFDIKNLEPNNHNIIVKIKNKKTNKEIEYKTFSKENNLYIFNFINLENDTEYEVSSFLVNNKLIKIKNKSNVSFKTKPNNSTNGQRNDNFVINNFEFTEIAQTQAKVIVNFSSNSLANNANKTFVLRINDQDYTINTYTPNSNKLEYVLTNLNSNTQYTIQSLKLNNNNINLPASNLSFTTSAQEQPSVDNFVISSIVETQKTNNSVSLRINFSTNQLADVNKKDFMLELNPARTISNLTFDQSKNYLDVNIDNLEQNTQYTIQALKLNNKTLTLPSDLPTIQAQQEQRNDNFVINNFEFNEIAQTQAKVIVNFSENTLANNANKTFVLRINEQDYTINSYVLNSNKLEYVLTNLTPNTQYTVQGLKLNNNLLSLPSSNLSFTTSTEAQPSVDNFVIESIIETAKSSNSLGLRINFSSNQLVDENNKNFVITLKDKILNVNNYDSTKNYLDLTFEELTPNTEYTVTNISLNNNNLQLPEQKTFITKQQVERDNFTISSMQINNITANSATVDITFDNHELRDDQFKNFEIEINDGRRLYYSFDQYIPGSNKISIDLNNLDLETHHSIDSLRLNSKLLNIPTNSNITREFTTASWNEPMTFNSVDYELSFEDANGNINMSLNVKNMFPLTKAVYEGFMVVVDQSDQKEYFIQFDISKNASNDNSGLNNLNIRLSEVYDEADEGEGESEDFAASSFLKNKQFKIKEIKTRAQGGANFHNAVISPENNIDVVFSTTDNSQKYQNVSLQNNNNDLMLSLNFINDLNDSQRVSAIVSGNNGWLSKINLRKQDLNWIATINDIAKPATYKLEKVLIDDSVIFANKSSIGTTSIQLSNSENNNNTEIESVTYESNNFDYSSLIKVKLNDIYDSRTLLEFQTPSLYLNKTNQSPIVIKLKEKNIANREFIYEVFGLEKGVQYNVQKLSFIGLEVVANSKSFTTKANVSKTNFTKNEIDSFVNTLTNIDLKKRWWASGIKQKIRNIEDLIKYTNINFSSLDLVNKNLELVIDQNNSFSNENERNGTLSLNIKFRSGNIESISKVLNFNNLYSYEWIRNNKQFVSNFNNLITISELGKSKSTKDFDNAFVDSKYDNSADLDSSLGGKPSVAIDLYDKKLKEFIDIDESLVSYDQNTMKVLFTKYTDRESAFGRDKTTPYAMLGYIQYKLMFWFDLNQFESKTRNAVIPIWLGGFNNYSDKNTKDLFYNFKNSLEIYSTQKYKEFANSYGFKQEHNSKTIDDVISELNEISDSKQKWIKLLELTNIERFINLNTSILKSIYEPNITQDNFDIGIRNVSKLVLGDNNFIEIEIFIKPFYTQKSDQQIESVVNQNVLKFKILKN